MREYFCAYHDMLGAMRKLSDAECGRLFRALLSYSAGDKPDNLQGREELLFDVFSQQIDRDAERYEQKCTTSRKNVSARWKRNSDKVGEGGAQSAADQKPEAGSAGGVQAYTDDTDVYGGIRAYTDDTDVYQRYQEKEKDKDKEKDNYYYRSSGGLMTDAEMDAAADAYRSLLGLAEDVGLPTSSRSADRLSQLLAEYGAEDLRAAIGIAEDAGKVSWRYVAGVLEKGRERGGISLPARAADAKAPPTLAQLQERRRESGLPV